jgi:DNA-binding MarR family transcriptional regulator
LERSRGPRGGESHELGALEDVGTRRQPLRLTEHDRTLLEFLAEHRIVRANHIRRLLGVSLPAAQRRLRRLGAAGYLERGRLYSDQPSHYLITRRGLRAVDSLLPPPRLDQMGYRHDVGLAWLWLAARTGAFGSLAAMHSERQMRSHDGRSAAGGERFGVRVVGEGINGGERLHYPDLLLETAAGHRVAVELELSAKAPARLERIIGRYVSDRRFDAVLYLVDDNRRAQQIRAAAAKLGAAKFVHVQSVVWSERAGPPRATRGAARGVPAPGVPAPGVPARGARQARGVAETER